MVIQHNIPALNSHRSLGINNANTAKNLEKLSSGYRINRAGDDAAGLAISEKMRGQIRGLSKAEENAKNGISLIQTAEGGLQEVHSILQRMRELAVQSSNGTYQNEVDRENLDLEFQSLKSEIDRISEYTHYNGINLLDGNLSSQARAVSDSSLFLGGKLAADVVNGQTYAVNLASTALALATEKSQTFKIGGDFTGVTPGAQTFDFTVNGKTYTTASITIVSGGEANQITAGIAAAFTAAGELKTMADNLGLSVTATGDSITVKMAAGKDPVDFDLNVNLKLDKSTTTKFETNVGDLYVADATAITVKGNADASAAAVANAFFDRQTNALTMVDANGNTFQLDGSQMKAATVYDMKIEAKQGENLVFQIGANGTEDQQISLAVQNVHSTKLGGYSLDTATKTPKFDGGTSVFDLNIAIRTNANSSIDVLDNAINLVSTQRAGLGALQNRLEYTLNNLGVTKENLTSAESVIRDVDMAKEMMDFTKNQILVQASQAMLAQANQLPQGVLNLLR